MPATPLSELLEAAGLTLPQLAAKVEEDPFLLSSAIAGRQPLPLSTAKKVALVLGLQLAEVLASVPSFTAGDSIDDHTPRPTDPTLGEPLGHAAVAPTVYPPPPPPSTPARLWVVGAGLGSGAAPGAKRIFIHDGSSDLQVTLAGVTAPHELAVDGTVGRLWTFGGADKAARFHPRTATVELSVQDPGYVSPKFCAALAGSVWVSNQGNNVVVRVNPFTGLPQATVALTVGMVTFTPRDMVAQGGKLHVVGAGSDGNWRLFRIDPAANAVDLSSTAAVAGDAWGLAYDPDGKRFWVSSQATPAAIFTVNETTYATAAQAVVGTPPTQPRQLHFGLGALWVADQKLPAATARLLEVDPGTLVSVGVREFAAAGPLGHVLDDGAFVWCSIPSAGHVHKLASNAIATTFLTVSTGGAPEGLLLTS